MAQAIQAIPAVMPTEQAQRSSLSIAISARVTKTYGSMGDFLKMFNPDRQLKVVAKGDRCFFGTAPTLYELNITYGCSMAKAWLIPQLFDLSEFCGCKDKLNARQMEQLADIIALQYASLKITEFMWFFNNFKSGKYGKFYGAVDPLVITTALQDFMDERAQRFAKHQLDIEQAERAQWSIGAITYEEYQRMKQAAQ